MNCPYGGCIALLSDESKLRNHITGRHEYAAKCGIPLTIFRNILYGEKFNPSAETRRRAAPEIRRFYPWTLPVIQERLDRQYYRKFKFNLSIKYKLVRDRERLDSMIETDHQQLRNIGKQLAQGLFSLS
ncbi:uncharacterized protein IL334_005411 [Kwoniella shivajii]|uniref:C2H2-type domain-containing protein n=1 Tax=Kwoniella shivajii TaxID=564305 RepID=A0ABZ1D4Y4_9TREE|nr:hypothetical protein IL334_005411 [Kwoniella shivajii]